MNEKNNLVRFKPVLDLLFTGMSVVRALELSGIGRDSFYTALTEDPLLAEAYSRAQAVRAEVLVDEAISIADSDIDPQKVRNRVDIRRWFASKILSSKYGDRLDINLQHNVDVRGALHDAKGRKHELIQSRDISKLIAQQVIDIADLPQRTAPVHLSGDTAESSPKLEDLL